MANRKYTLLWEQACEDNPQNLAAIMEEYTAWELWTDECYAAGLLSGKTPEDITLQDLQQIAQQQHQPTSKAKTPKPSLKRKAEDPQLHQHAQHTPPLTTPAAAAADAAGTSAECSSKKRKPAAAAADAAGTSAECSSKKRKPAAAAADAAGTSAGCSSKKRKPAAAAAATVNPARQEHVVLVSNPPGRVRFPLPPADATAVANHVSVATAAVAAAAGATRPTAGSAQAPARAAPMRQPEFERNLLAIADITPHNLAEFTADYLNSDEGRQGLVNQGIDKLKALQAAASAEYNQATIAVKAAGHAIVVYKEHVKANKELICESVEQNMAKIAGSLKGDMPEFRDLLKRFTRHVAQKASVAEQQLLSSNALQALQTAEDKAKQDSRAAFSRLNAIYTALKMAEDLSSHQRISGDTTEAVLAAAVEQEVFVDAVSDEQQQVEIREQQPVQQRMPFFGLFGFGG